MVSSVRGRWRGASLRLSYQRSISAQPVAERESVVFQTQHGDELWTEDASCCVLRDVRLVAGRSGVIVGPSR